MKLTDADHRCLDEIKANWKSMDGIGLEQSVERLLRIIDRLTQEPEVVESEWVNIKPCTNDAVEYADFIAYLARTEMGVEFWECKVCGSFDSGFPTRKPCHCRGCGATMRNGDFDKSETNGGERRKEQDDEAN